MGRSSESLAAVTAEIELARGVDARFDDAVKRLSAELGDPDQLPLRARRIAGLLALCLQGSLLLRHAPAPVADAFCASRLGGDWGAVLGTLPATTDVASLVRRSIGRSPGLRAPEAVVSWGRSTCSARSGRRRRGAGIRAYGGPREPGGRRAGSVASDDGSRRSGRTWPSLPTPSSGWTPRPGSPT